MFSLSHSISTHPGLALAFIFATSGAESLAIVGTLVPAGMVMLTAGALVAAGALSTWSTVAVGALGAMAGDCLSYELGRRYHNDVKLWVTARGGEQFWARGERMTARHGAKSIIAGRFLAPARAIVPIAAGCAQMPRRVFYLFDWPAALAWSIAHIVPGIVLGTSAALVETFATRLALPLLVGAALLCLGFFEVRSRHCGRKSPVMRMWQHVTRLHEHVRTRLDGTAQTLQCWTAGAFAILLAGLIQMSVNSPHSALAGDALRSLDTVLPDALNSLRTPRLDVMMAGLAAAHGCVAGLCVTAIVLALLARQRRWRMAAWVITAASIAIALGVAFGAPPLTIPLAEQIAVSGEHFPAPDGHAAFATLLYGFLGWMLTYRHGGTRRRSVTLLTVLWLAAGGAANLFMGRCWPIDLLVGSSIGIGWLALLVGSFLFCEKRKLSIIPP